MTFKQLMIFTSAPYFIDCISEQDLDEMNIEIIRNTLYKVMNATISKLNLFSIVIAEIDK